MNDAAMGAEIVRFSHVSKHYPGTLANDDVSLTIRRGEVFALVGENGAGKSTLMNLLYGLQAPTLGEIYIKGKPTGPQHGPENAMRMGVSMVHQHFKLVPSFTVAQNVMLGHEPRRGLFYDGHEAEETVRRLSAEYGLKVEPGDVVRDLSVGIQQRVEILKALRTGADVLILDEPTAVLTPQEAEELFEVIRRVVEEKNMTVILITHRLPEVMRVSDRVGVMRRGRLEKVMETRNTSEREIASLMVGRDVLFGDLPGGQAAGEERLVIRGLCALGDRGLPALRGMDLTVRAGEVVGVCGVEGNGQTELVYGLTGLEKLSGGKITLDGKDITRESIRQRSKDGMSHIPEDRHKHGLVLDYSLENNMVLQRYWQPEFQKGGFIQSDKVREYSDKLIAQYDVRSGQGSSTIVRSMSGGNQQKAIIAREIDKDPKLLVAVQPTRGLDVGAIEYIHRQIVAERDKGKAVLLVSLELDEVMNLSDRILVMYEGEIVGEFDPKTTTVQELGLYMAGARKQGKESK